MIIVSQDRKSMFNFNNIKSIDVIENTIDVTDNILANAGMEIAKYETEERAKEVLEEIIQAATIKQLNGKSITKDQFNMFVKTLEFNVYEMPLK